MTEKELDNGNDLKCKLNCHVTTTNKCDNNDQCNLNKIEHVKIECEHNDFQKENKLDVSEIIFCTDDIKTETPDILNEEDIISLYRERHAEGEIKTEPTEIDDSNESTEAVKRENIVFADPLDVKNESDCDFSGVDRSNEIDLEKKAEPAITEDGEFRCRQCPYTARFISLFKIHQQTHNEFSEFKCGDCHKCFKTSKSLSAHQDVHNDPDQYRCKLCPFRTKRKQGLKRHLELHDEMKRFRCGTCFRRFEVAEDLNAHVQEVHGDEWPFQCAKCPYKTKKKIQLKQHLLAHEDVMMNYIMLSREITKR